MGKRIKRYLVVAILLGMGALSVVEGFDKLRESWRLKWHGVKTTGKVIDHHTGYVYKRGTQYYLTVTFQPDQRAAVTADLKVDASDYSAALAAGVIPVHYWPGDPDVCAAGQTVPLRFGVLLTGLAMFFGGLYLVWYFRSSAKQLAGLCISEHQYETVDASQYRNLDHSFYEEGRLVLETHGYRFLADREDLTFRRSSGLQIPLRILVSRDGAVVAGIYHLRPRWHLRALGAKDARVLDLQTRWSNGEWLLTSNAQAAGTLDQPPGVDGIFLLADTCIETVIESHAKRVALYAQKHPGVEPVRAATLDDVERLAAELQRIKAEFRRRHGLSQAELQRIAGVDKSTELEILHDGINAAHQSNQRKSA